MKNTSQNKTKMKQKPKLSHVLCPTLFTVQSGYNVECLAELSLFVCKTTLTRYEGGHLNHDCTSIVVMFRRKSQRKHQVDDSCSILAQNMLRFAYKYMQKL